MFVKIAQKYIKFFEKQNFRDIIISLKSSCVTDTVAAYRKLADLCDYPLHLGLTHAGTAETGAIRSTAALGALLAEGIGDTIRVSLAGDPLREVAVAKELLASLRLRQRDEVEIIACPTCGRTEADVAALAEDVRTQLAGAKSNISIAVMGCVVNGPGEAEGVDVAACCGKGKADIYVRGRRLRSVPADDIVKTLVAEARRLIDSCADD